MLVFSFSFVFIDTKDSLSMPICEDFMKRQIFITFVLLILCALDLPAQTPFVSKVWKTDNGDGTYKNPIFSNAQNTPKHTNVSTYTTIQKIGKTGEVQLRLPTGKYVIATSENPGFALISNDIKLKSRNDGVILLGIRSAKWIQEAPQSYEILKTRFKVLNLKSGKTLQLL